MATALDAHDAGRESALIQGLMVPAEGAWSHPQGVAHESPPWKEENGLVSDFSDFSNLQLFLRCGATTAPPQGLRPGPPEDESVRCCLSVSTAASDGAPAPVVTPASSDGDPAPAAPRHELQVCAADLGLHCAAEEDADADQCPEEGREPGPEGREQPQRGTPRHLRGACGRRVNRLQWEPADQP